MQIEKLESGLGNKKMVCTGNVYVNRKHGVWDDPCASAEYTESVSSPNVDSTFKSS